MKPREDSETAREDAPRQKPRRVEELVPNDLTSYRAARQGKLVRRARDAEAERLGVSVDEWRLLFVLARFGPLPSIRISEHAIMDRGTVSRAVAKMEERGLVFRISDTSDRRISIVNLTEQGTGIADQISSFMLNRELEMIADLTDEEWRIWLTVTDKIYDRLKTMYEDD